MVSFTCNRCQDVVKKPKVVTHAATCHCDSFTCVDCMQHFTLDTIKSHTTCVTEVDKYQGRWLLKKATNGDSSKAKTAAQAKGARTHDDDSEDDAGAAQARQPARRPRMTLSDSDDDDDSWVLQKKRAKSDSSAAAPATTATTTTRPRDEAKEATTTTTRTRDEAKNKRGSSDAAAVDCVVPSFVLGSAREVGEVARDILAGGGLPAKQLARELVGRYAKRIAKSLQAALDTAAAAGVLRRDARDNFTAA